MKIVYINIESDENPNYKKGLIINYNKLNDKCDVQIMMDNKSYAKDENGILTFTIPFSKILDEKPKIIQNISEPIPTHNIDIENILKELNNNF